MDHNNKENQTTEDEREGIFYDIMINFFMNNRMLYDKMEEKFSYTIEKLEKLNVLKNYLKDVGIEKSVPEIINAWRDLVKKFKKYDSDESRAKSGSGAIENNFPYYNELLFLKEAISNRKALSSLQVTTTPTYNNFETAGTSNSINSTPSQSFSFPATNFLPQMPMMSASQNSGIFTHPYMLQYPTFIQDYSQETIQSTNSLSSAGSSLPQLNKGNISARAKSARTLNTPEYDCSAKKKLKQMNETDSEIRAIGKMITKTLGSINQISTSGISTTDDSTRQNEKSFDMQQDYKALLTEAVSKVPSNSQIECLEYVLEQLDNYDKQNKKKDCENDTM